jgi:hypothetical protein
MALHLRVAAVVACLLLALATWPFINDLRPPRITIKANGVKSAAHDICDFAQDWASARNLLEGQAIYRDPGEFL